MTPQGYRCPNCNAMLPISRTYRGICTCECCGSEYRIKSEYEIEPLKVEVCQVDLIPICARQIINDEELQCAEQYGKKEEFIEQNLKSLSRQLAEQIVTFMEVQIEKDMMYRQTIIQSRVRIAKPTGSTFRDLL